MMFMNIFNFTGKYLFSNDKHNNEDPKLYYLCPQLCRGEKCKYTAGKNYWSGQHLALRLRMIFFSALQYFSYFPKFIRWHDEDFQPPNSSHSQYWKSSHWVEFWVPDLLRTKVRRYALGKIEKTESHVGLGKTGIMLRGGQSLPGESFVLKFFLKAELERPSPSLLTQHQKDLRISPRPQT